MSRCQAEAIGRGAGIQYYKEWVLTSSLKREWVKFKIFYKKDKIV
ncbi:hypothetical protein CLV98_11519 [Dyadobacter jejuensis]|uniref:Uncharacterized protein n=1 Tax=Dyadobacter jejuensis TaxID=1082580 RepID=A0A316ADF7_9BACT|nr:hypothetical protein CLV98_11519 [Dyadobacter jejuensis]